MEAVGGGLVRFDAVDALEHVGLVCYVIDRGGRIRWLNGAARTLLGDAVGRNFLEFVHSDCAAAVRREFARKLNGAEVTDYRAEVVGRRGERVAVEISSVPLRDGDSVLGVFGIARVASAAAPRPPVHRLTPRQAEVLRLLAHGASTAQMEADLHLSRETIRNHVRQLLRALDVHSRLEAVVVARRDGLLDSAD